MPFSSRDRLMKITTGEALFLLGVAVPLLAGGNTLFVLEPETAIHVFDLVTVLVAWQLLRSGTGTEDRSWAVRVATYSLLVLAPWWTAALLFRVSGPRASLEAQGIFCGILLFTSLSHRELVRETLSQFVRGLLVGTLATAAFGQYQYWIAFPRTAPLAQAAGIPVIAVVNANFYNANCYGVFLAAVTLLGIGLAAERREPLAWGAIPVFTITLLLSESRSTVVLLLLGLLLLAASSESRLRVAFGRLGTAALWVLLPGAVGAAAGMVDLQEFWRVGALGRVAIWQGSLAMIRDHWVLGIGLGSFADYFTRYRLNTYYTRYPHSFLLEIAAELGIIGFAAVSVFLACSLARPISLATSAVFWHGSRSISPLWLAVALACAVLVLHGLVDIDWHAPANPILLCILLGAAQSARAA